MSVGHMLVCGHVLDIRSLVRTREYADPYIISSRDTGTLTLRARLTGLQITHPNSLFCAANFPLEVIIVVCLE